MSANALFVSVLIVLALAALAVRLATGPILPPEPGDSLYARAKAGPVPGAMAVELAARGTRPGR